MATWPALVVASYYAGTRTRHDILIHSAVSVVTFSLAVTVATATGGYREVVIAGPVNLILLVIALVALPVIAGMWVRARRQVLEIHTDQARKRERTRIAREMHDVVAHRVSLMVLHAGALEMNAPDPRTAEAAMLIGGIGREALTNLRDVLGVLRSPDEVASLSPQPTLADLDILLDQSRALGMTITRHDGGARRGLDPTVERTAYRVIQEALTNVHKHAGDAKTDIYLTTDEDRFEVEVRNRRPVGGRPGRPLPGTGWGLPGLRERVELTGGTLSTSPTPDGGFALRASIPIA
ncbi:sensor histidine kinase [Acrocarpospora corrugata]|uniref:sensor histidine kinase n=1 Tax=Acrocarpospora corrugata TaxID=35763 RepID=UPI0012D3568B|nr:histidine kinase [Acrocarpospora corrugata]